MTKKTLIEKIQLSNYKLTQSDTTKHIHGLHPCLGKFIPQLASYFLNHELKNAKFICDPFLGSGTTLIESNISNKKSMGLDVSIFNILLSNVKVNKYNIISLSKEINDILYKTKHQLMKTTLDNFISNKENKVICSEYLKTWFHPEALHVLLVFRELIHNYKHQDVLKIILTRTARSSRLIAHYDSVSPKKPQSVNYYCYKHKHICFPTKNALLFLKQYCNNTIYRIKQFQQIRNKIYTKAFHGDSTKFDFSKFNITDIITSPPYIGLIDYHKQHQYAYNLLQLKDNSNLEIGSKKQGVSKSAVLNYKINMIKTIKNIKESLCNRNGLFIIVVNDNFNIYNDIIHDSGLCLTKKLIRDVIHRSSGRSSNFQEYILICKLKQ